MMTSGINVNTKFTGWWGQFMYKDQQLLNERTGQAIENSRGAEGGQVNVNNRNGSIGQKWTITYVD